jgi:small subunit ribosomal protein S17
MAEEPENVEETPAEDAPAEAAAPEAADAAAATGAAPADDAPAPAAAAPAEVVPPKERKRRAKAAKSAKTPTARPRSPEERHEDRVAERKRKAALRRAGRVKERAKSRATEHQPPTPAREHMPGTQKTRQGVVVSSKADKTITVRIDIQRRHRKYQKIVATSTKVHAHDERNDANEGDTVIVRECRPLSRSKRWRLVEVVERAQ